jgi:aryl-alcohol dehydrogenase-like predicted oxidoreductase
MSTTPAPVRHIAAGQLAISPLGLGCMGMSQSYGPADDAESIRAIHAAIDNGMNFLDTADVYGAGRNEELVGRAIAGRREQVVLATKFGLTPRDASGVQAINGRPENVRPRCEASLRRLGVDYIDLYYAHRVDRDVPIEETVGAMAELVEAGLIGHLGLSEASVRSIERASSVHPIAALQSEWSLWSREIEDEVLPMARAHGVAVVAYCPLGRGLLTGGVTAPDGFAPGDSRATNPRFAPDNFAHNYAQVIALREIAARYDRTPAQLALAWLLARGPDVLAIPGSKRVAHVLENAAAATLELSAEDLKLVDAAVPRGSASGERSVWAQPYGDTPELV